MTIDRLKRVMFRLREIEPSRLYSNKQIRLAIMEESGTDERTIKNTINKLIELKLLVKADFGKMKEDETRTQEE